MLSPHAAEAFRTREFRDSKGWKDAGGAQVRAWIESRVPFRLRFRHKPRAHQWVGMGLALCFRRFYFAFDMGTGKSKLIIDSFEIRRCRQEARRCLVLVPYAVNLGQWQQQVEEHAPHLRCAVLKGARATKQRRLDGDAHIVVSTYAGIRTMLSQARPGKGRLPDPKAIDEFRKYFDYIVLDEADAIGSHTALTFRVLKQLTDGDQFLYLLSGMPIGRDAQRLWAAAYLIDRGWLLGPTISMYRAVLFREQQTNYGTEFILRQKYRSLLHRMMRHLSVRYESSECLDLPEKVGGCGAPMLVPVEFTDTQWALYDEVQRQMTEAADVNDTVGGAYFMLRTITSGWYKDPTMGVPVDIPGRNPKLEGLLELLRSIDEQQGEGTQVIVVHHYNATGQLIERALQAAKVATASVRGDLGDGNSELARFESGQAQVLVGSSSIAYGLNLQFCRCMVVFESPDKLQVRRQIEDRIYRMGQRYTCYYWDLVIQYSVDEAILRALRTGKRVADCVIDGKSGRKRV